MFNKEVFDKLADEIRAKLTELRTSDLRIVKKEDSGCFIRVFKDSLFEYNDGIILLERLYKPNCLNKKSVRYAYLEDKDKEALAELEKVSSSMPSISELSKEESSEYIDTVNDLCAKVSGIETKYGDLDLEYYDASFGIVPVKSMTTLTDEEIAGRAVLSASFALSMYQSIFLEDTFVDGISILGIEQNEYLDIVVVPYSNEKKEEN